ncbi:MAG: hypothetical protein ACOX6N_05565, partial [Patescibacteria group bacterium]
MINNICNAIDFSSIRGYTDDELYQIYFTDDSMQIYGGQRVRQRVPNQYQTQTITENVSNSTITKPLDKSQKKEYEYIGVGRKIQNIPAFNVFMNQKRKLILMNNNIAKKKLDDFYRMGYFNKNLNDIIEDALFKKFHDSIISSYMICPPSGLDVPYEKINDLEAEDYHEIMKYRTRQGYSDIITIYGPDFARIITNVAPNYLEVFILYYLKKFAVQYYEANKKHI